MATECFFCDHNGVVHFDPVFQETKFKLLESCNGPCSAVSYNEQHGTLAYADMLGKILYDKRVFI